MRVCQSGGDYPTVRTLFLPHWQSLRQRATTSTLACLLAAVYTFGEQQGDRHACCDHHDCDRAQDAQLQTREWSTSVLEKARKQRPSLQDHHDRARPTTGAQKNHRGYIDRDHGQGRRRSCWMSPTQTWHQGKVQA